MSDLKKGLTEKSSIKDRKELGGVTPKGQRPVSKKEKVSSDRGKFTIV